MFSKSLRRSVTLPGGGRGGVSLGASLPYVPPRPDHQDLFFIGSSRFLSSAPPPLPRPERGPSFSRKHGCPFLSVLHHFQISVALEALTERYPSWHVLLIHDLFPRVASSWMASAGQAHPPSLRFRLPCPRGHAPPRPCTTQSSRVTHGWRPTRRTARAGGGCSYFGEAW